MPPPPLSGPQLRESINNIRSPHVELNGVKSSVNHALFTAIATSDLKHNATSLSLNECCLDSEDLVTLCYALPRVESLQLSSITPDRSRAMIRKIERAAPVPMGFFVPSATSTSDWSSFSESMASTVKTRRLHLKEIVVEGTEWTNELCESLIGLVERIDESVKFTLRVQLPVVPSQSFEDVHGENATGQDPIGEQLELFTRFLEICGTKIDRLDVCLVSLPVVKFEPRINLFGVRETVRSVNNRTSRPPLRSKARTTSRYVIVGHSLPRICANCRSARLSGW